MYAKFYRKRGGFTLIELAATMALVSFALGGFMLLWAGVAKQEDRSWTERTIDAYGNFLMYRINQDMKNAFTYSLFRSGNLYGIDLETVDYSNRIPDTLRIRWQVRSNGDATRWQNLNSSTNITSMFNEFFGRSATNLGANEQMYCTQFKLTPVGTIVGHERDLGLLDSAGVQMDLSLKYVNSHPQLTVNEGLGRSDIQMTPYERVFSWTTMVYMRNFYINRFNAGNATLF